MPAPCQGTGTALIPAPVSAVRALLRKFQKYEITFFIPIILRIMTQASRRLNPHTDIFYRLPFDRKMLIDAVPAVSRGRLCQKADLDHRIYGKMEIAHHVEMLSVGGIMEGKIISSISETSPAIANISHKTIIYDSCVIYGFHINIFFKNRQLFIIV